MALVDALTTPLFSTSRHTTRSKSARARFERRNFTRLGRGDPSPDDDDYLDCKEHTPWFSLGVVAKGLLVDVDHRRPISEPCDFEVTLYPPS